MAARCMRRRLRCSTRWSSFRDRPQPRLGLTLSIGTALADQSAGIQVETLLKTATSWDGSVLPSHPVGQPEITVLRITVAPGTELPLHRHPVMANQLTFACTGPTGTGSTQ